MTLVLMVFAVLVTGVMVGVELSVATVIAPVAGRLSAQAEVAARADSARALGRVMPFWYGLSGLATAGLVAVTWGSAAAWAALGALLLLVASVVMSVTLLVPINNRVAGWVATGAPPNWKAEVAVWDRWHQVRVVLIVLALAGVAAAVAAG